MYDNDDKFDRQVNRMFTTAFILAITFFILVIVAVVMALIFLSHHI
jgi:hypothetical protein